MRIPGELPLRRLAVSLLSCAALATLGALAFFSPSAFAVECDVITSSVNPTGQCKPGWEVVAHTNPTYLQPGGRGTIVVVPVNVGAASSEGTVTVTDTLPPGVTAMAAGLGGAHFVGPEETEFDPDFEPRGGWICSGNGPGGAVAGATVVTCRSNPELLPSFTGGRGTPTGLGIGGREAVPGNSDPELFIGVRAPSGKGSATETLAEPNRVTIAGGGAPNPASTSTPVTISSKQAPFGFSAVDAWFSNANGTIDTQAGSHPYEATFVVNMNMADSGTFPRYQPSGDEPRDLTFDLPPGFIGNPNVVPTCTEAQFNQQACPPTSQVGIITVSAPGETFYNGGTTNTGGFQDAPVFNIVPPAGEPAEFGFQIESINTLLGTSVASGSNFAIDTQVNNIPQVGVLGSYLTLWGQPTNSSHDPFRVKGLTSNAGSGEERPFLTLPTSCEGPQEYSVSMSGWEDPSDVVHARFLSHNASDEPTGFTGCENLNFSPALKASADTSNADTPAGLSVEVKPQIGGLLAPDGLGTSDIKEATVTLPPGVVINPGQAAGLEACGPSEDGLTTAAEEAEGREDSGPPSCPLASKVGTDEITLPILKNSLQGNVYILESEPPHIKILIAASGEGVNVKLVGNVSLNEQTGQLTTTVETGYQKFPGIPQAPVSDFKLSFSGGAQAALDTPTKCGTYTTESVFTSWASPLVASVSPTSMLGITAGTNGAPCPPSPLPYTPELIAGSTTDQAGGFTDFSLLLQVPDDQQRTERLQFKTPEGLLGEISKVPLCTNAQAEANACPEASQIGHTVVASGPGPYPLVIPQPGQPPAPIYLTEGYGGAPYGLSIVVPIHVGPFTLPTQRVRAKIEVDPLTTQLTIVTDALPQVVAGVPTDLRSIDAVIDKPGFMFNPTGCDSRSFSGTAYGTEGAQAPISSHFQMGSCRALLFQPNFKVSTAAKTSRTDGASLGVKIVYPTGNLGANQASSQSNIGSIKVELPKRLPSRLTTLQKACTAAQFNANPAGCPAASVVGHATAVTPVLPVPLSGPAYFVSNGGEAFPNLIIVLQGYGVTVHLVGDTFISKAGITSSTFKSIPDVPIASFELNLPEGPFSALTADGNLCKGTLTMPTDFVAQNGAVLDQNTTIAVTGCAKTKKLTRAEKLAKALKVCHRERGDRRARCVKAARRNA